MATGCTFEHRSLTGPELPWERSRVASETPFGCSVPLWSAAMSSAPRGLAGMPPIGFPVTSPSYGPTPTLAQVELRVVMCEVADTPESLGWKRVPGYPIPCTLAGLRDADWHLAPDELDF
jgi:hypothetical protein